MVLCDCACSSVADKIESLSQVENISDLFSQQDDEADIAADAELG